MREMALDWENRRKCNGGGRTFFIDEKGRKRRRKEGRKRETVVVRVGLNGERGTHAVSRQGRVGRMVGDDSLSSPTVPPGSSPYYKTSSNITWWWGRKTRGDGRGGEEKRGAGAAEQCVVQGRNGRRLYTLWSNVRQCLVKGQQSRLATTENARRPPRLSAEGLARVAR
jgi:hypothetical protein